MKHFYKQQGPSIKIDYTFFFHGFNINLYNIIQWKMKYWSEQKSVALSLLKRYVKAAIYRMLLHSSIGL